LKSVSSKCIRGAKITPVIADNMASSDDFTYNKKLVPPVTAWFAFALFPFVRPPVPSNRLTDKQTEAFRREFHGRIYSRLSIRKPGIISCLRGNPCARRQWRTVGWRINDLV
jgi:hypothetical protein